jgi:hypothetical protein
MTALDRIDLAKHAAIYDHEIYRLVEGQHYISTRPLVDSDEEHDVLENLLDASKPPAPTENARGALHYLLYTPFRYPPLKSGGRFHTRIEQSIFYGSEDLQTSMAEVAYGRFLFMQHSAADFEPMQVPYTHFVAVVKSARALLLTTTPFSKHRAVLSHPTSYAASQAFGTRMRQAGVELFTYYSARNPDGVNVGLFSVEAFKKNQPVKGKDGHWSVFISSDTVEFKRPHLSDNAKESHVFRAADLSGDLRITEAAKEMLAHRLGEVTLQTRKVPTKK